MNRRDFLKQSSLVAVGGTIPMFLARTAQAAEVGKDTILVVLEMTGGNDGLNTVIPYADEQYYKFRPTIGIKKAELKKVNDSIGLHPRLQGLANLLQNNQLAIVQGVGYPNPDRSHFESMDIWQAADPRRKQKTGWLSRAAGTMGTKDGGFAAMQVGPGKLPFALTGNSGGIVSLGEPESFELALTGAADRQKSRKKLLEDLNKPSATGKEELTDFVQRRQLQTLKAIEKVREALNQSTPGSNSANVPQPPATTTFRAVGNETLSQKLQIVARLIQKGLGTRIYYVSIDGFDTHSNQADQHGILLGEIGNAVEQFFNTLQGGDGKRVVLMTFSEFGRRVKENGSQGTDHGAASCMFVAGPAIKAGAIGKYPSLGDLDDGDLKFNIDFRRVYATLLDQWLGCDSQHVLESKFDHIELLAKKS